jgi:hypothetical protein
MNAPLDMKSGGRIIFSAFVGFFAAFIRTTKARVPIKTAPIEEATTKFIRFIPYLIYFLTHYISKEYI